MVVFEATVSSDQRSAIVDWRKRSPLRRLPGALGRGGGSLDSCKGRLLRRRDWTSLPVLRRAAVFPVVGIWMLHVENMQAACRSGLNALFQSMLHRDFNKELQFVSEKP
jgi:hypothetical protein